MTVYCYDTEFLENGQTIELISIGIVAEDGREYYAVNADMPSERIRKDDWLMINVVPHLPGSKPYRLDGHGLWIWVLSQKEACVKPKWAIANEVRDFLLTGNEPVLWAYYGAYDHVALAQLYGRMIDLPSGFPMWTHEIKQLAECMGVLEFPVQSGDEHNALADARWNMEVLNMLRQKGDDLAGRPIPWPS